MAKFGERESIDEFLYSEIKGAKKYSGAFNSPPVSESPSAPTNPSTPNPDNGGSPSPIEDNGELVSIGNFADRVFKDRMVLVNLGRAYEGYSTKLSDPPDNLTDSYKMQDIKVIPEKIQNVLRVPTNGGTYLFWNKDEAATTYNVYKDGVLYETVRPERFQTFIEGPNGTSMSLQIEAKTEVTAPVFGKFTNTGEKSDAITTTPLVVTANSKSYNSKALSSFDFGPASTEVDTFIDKYPAPRYIFSTRDANGKTHIYFISTTVSVDRPESHHFLNGNTFKVSGNLLSKEGTFSLDGYVVPSNEEIVCIQFIPELPFALIAAEMRTPFAEVESVAEGLKVKISATEYDKFNIYLDEVLVKENLRGIQPSAIIEAEPLKESIIKVERITSGGQSTIILEETAIYYSNIIEDFSDNELHPKLNLTGDWIIDTTSKRLRSSVIGDKGRSESLLTFTTTSKSKMSFQWKCSSEQGYDYLYLNFDNKQILSTSGETYSSYSDTINPGDHTLILLYSKDSSGSRGLDMGSISEFKIEAIK